MITLLKTLSSTRVLVILGILFLAFNAVIPQFLPKDYALDLRFAYSKAEACYLLSQLSFEQISDYKFGLLALDMPYLLTYSLFFGCLLFRLWGNSLIVVAPFLAALADFSENVSVYRILNSLPSEADHLFLWASVSSTTKWIFVVILFSGVFGGILRKILSKKSAIVNSQEIKI